MSNETSDVVLKDDHVTTVPKDFFFEGMQLPVPVYLKMTPGHYLMIGKKGDKANFSQFHSFKNKQTEVFVKNQDHPFLIHFVTSLTGKVIAQKNMPDSIKVKFLVGLAEEALSAIDGRGFTSVRQLQKVSQCIVDLTSNMSSFSEIMMLLAEVSNYEARHAMTTTFIALSICEEMQVTHKTALEKIALGCMLHDIGLRFIPESILKKPKHEWTAEENAIFESHPIKGVEMLRDLKDVSNDVLLIVAEHHENSIGTGFPKRIRDVKISPLGRIVILASNFTDLLFSRFEGGSFYQADEALNYIEDILGQPFNKQVFLALKNIVNKKYLHDKSKS
jgi:putative nucleotidyltransferase with HDIG domain